MSRGLGSLQRRLLAELVHGASSARTLSDRLGANYESTRRALHALLARDLIAVDGCYAPDPNGFAARWQRHYMMQVAPRSNTYGDEQREVRA